MFAVYDIQGQRSKNTPEQPQKIRKTSTNHKVT